MMNWKMPEFITHMTPKAKTIAIVSIILVIVLIVGILWGARVQLPRKLWYMMPTRQDFYIFVGTNLTAQEAKNCTLTITKLTGFGEEVITGEYWPEENLFHAIVEERGLYRIQLTDPAHNGLDRYVEVGHDEIYFLTYIPETEPPETTTPETNPPETTAPAP